ncbi:hypothetical protein ROHU_025973 [Labeo rohita]|uniref:Uncharacterized protein n=1 Tax=Labeo rohita TaxID=84645 RepID=A0A498MG80_LABRO|nr:hypothetical protein ROHU_032091 [Labeo rohita]RXN18833.1 hypothetical protein ROHU_025973 [Labeo rohita]
MWPSPFHRFLRPQIGSADVSGNIQRSVDGSVPIQAERRGRTRRPLRANSGGVVADPLASVPLDWKVPVSKSD